MTEKQVYEALVQLYRRVGCFVSRLSQARASRQTAGVPDLYIMLPRAPQGAWWHEVKTPTGRLSPAQRAWRTVACRSGLIVITGGVDEALAYLRTLRIVR